MKNIIEQDHRTVKWKMNHAMGYHTMWHAATTITGVETMHMLRKRQWAYYSKQNTQSLWDFIHRLFDITGAIFRMYLKEKWLFNLMDSLFFRPVFIYCSFCTTTG